MEKAFDRCSWEFLEDGLAAIGFGQGFIDYVLCSRTRTRHTAHAPHIQTRLWSRAGCPLPPSSSSSSQIPLCASSTKIGTPPTVFRPETRPIAMKSPYSPALFAEDSTLILRTADIQDALRTLHPNLVRCNKQGVTRPHKREVLLLGLPRRHPELLGNTGSCPAHSRPQHTIVRNGTTIRVLGVP